MQEVHATLPVGTILRGRYVVEDVLGKGRSGSTYLVRDQRNNQHLFVLKQVPDSVRKDRYQFAFAKGYKRLRHPALPRVYHMFNDRKQDRAYMLMDYIEGPNLEMLQQNQPEQRFSLSLAIFIIAPIMSAVAYLPWGCEVGRGVSLPPPWLLGA